MNAADLATLPDPDAPSRPALRYFGGKYLLSDWVISHFPPHRVYVEPFGGAASVLLQKRRAYAEVYNDLDGDVVNYFRVLRDPVLSEQLVRAVVLTPFARDEFFASYEPTDDPVERARRTVLRSFMGHGANAQNIASRTGFRADANNAGTSPGQDWLNFPPALARIAERMRGVVIENRPALSIVDRFDKPHTLFYFDPPYVHVTRRSNHDYLYEMGDDDHVAFLDRIVRLRGMAVVSGYPHPLYEERLSGWRRVEKGARADGQGHRTEVLWINPAADAARAARPEQEALL